MKEIKPTYVNFTTAKWLKEKGFDEKCNFGYNQSEKYLGTFVDIRNKNSENIVVSAPEQWVVVEWLRINHGIWIEVLIDDNKSFGYLISKFTKDGRLECPLIINFTSPQEAYSAAFDYIRLNSLI